MRPSSNLTVRSQKNKLTLNCDKTELLYLNRKHTRNRPIEDTNNLERINIYGKELVEKEQIKYLGFIIKTHLIGRHNINTRRIEVCLPDRFTSCCPLLGYIKLHCDFSGT